MIPLDIPTIQQVIDKGTLQNIYSRTTKFMFASAPIPKLKAHGNCQNKNQNIYYQKRHKKYESSLSSSSILFDMWTTESASLSSKNA